MSVFLFRCASEAIERCNGRMQARAVQRFVHQMTAIFLGRAKPRWSCLPMPPVDAAFKDWFGVMPAGATVLAALYAAQGTEVRHTDLLDIAGPRGVERIMVSLTEALDEGAFTEGPNGYALTAAGQAECGRAIAEFAAVQLRA